MSNFFNGNRFYPQNFFVFKNDSTDMAALLDTISSEASKLSPESFDAETDFFTFVFRYHPPYVGVREFPEMRRLQETAMSHTRFKEEYNGYIAIDIGEWIGHSDEEHFINCLCFLRDMSPHWKYVFFTDSERSNEFAQKAFQTIRQFIWTHMLSFDELPGCKFVHSLSNRLKNVHGKTLSSASKELLEAVFCENGEKEIVSAANDIAAYFEKEKVISERSLAEYLTNPSAYTNFIMSEQELSALKNYISEKEKKI